VIPDERWNTPEIQARIDRGVAALDRIILASAMTRPPETRWSTE